ncbi:MAG: PorT family protein [Bacteroidales bacterium]|nr:PorT family protein [Bacteroidales bacterium]
MKKRYILFLVFTCLVLFSLNAQRYNRNSIKKANTKEQIRIGLTAGLNLGDLTSATGLDIWNGLAYYDIEGNYIGFTDTKPFKKGFSFGVTFQYNLSGYWWAQSGLLFATKGYKLETQDIDIDATTGYVQVPIEIMYKFPVKKTNFIVSAGLFAGIGVYGFTDYEDHYGENASPRLNHPFSPDPLITGIEESTNLIGCDITVHGANDYWKDKDDTFASDGTWIFDGGVKVGVGVEWWRLQFMINYQYSLTPLYDYGYDYTSRYEVRDLNYKNSFDYFGLGTMSSPRQHVFSFTLTYFFDNWNHGIRL